VDRTVINAAAAPKLRLLRQSGPRMVEIRSRSIITDAADGADGVMQLVLAYGRYLLLKAILTCYKDADSRCRHEIFGDIFFLAFGISTVWPHEEFPADNAEQTFVPSIEHAGS
jgi:hypothetical protein